MKNKIFFIIVAIFLMVVLIINLKDTYSYYIDTNNLSLVSSKIGKFGSVSKNDLKKNAGDQLQDTAVFGLYRYVGSYETVLNNYICFGTSDKNTCLNTSSAYDNYMYRIIGITDNSTVNTDLNIPENSLKIIQNYYIFTPEGPMSERGFTSFGGTDIYNYLYYDFYPKISSEWKNLILDNHEWYTGPGTWLATTENTSKKEIKSPVSLMYYSDYINSQPDGSDYTRWLSLDAGKAAWQASQNEWTMTFTGSDNYFFTTSGSSESQREIFYYRPCFYLIPDIKLTGTGTSTDPYLINIS